ncbi:chemotaxis protein CheW [Synechocystis sp. LKSZ1]|uniref:chemotaxis protein CheW n=1 Tax=Synechocystis sp. LKSZ1 TaxID=3144951 RepID=UPI00336BE06F
MNTLPQPTSANLSRASLPNQEPPAKATRSTAKFLLFTLGKLHLALPIDQVVRILNYATVHGSGTTATGIIHLEDRSVTVIDLGQRLLHRSQLPSAVTKQFLILAKNRLGEEFALVVPETPTLIDVAVEQMRILPDSYRQNDTLNCASHVMVIPQPGQSLTVFLLDPDALVATP